MKQSINIMKVAGIKISVHWTFFILIAWIIIANYRQNSGVDELIFTLLFILTLFACVTLHELGHALTAKSFGIRTRSIILLPIGGVAQMDELPEKPSQEFLVALAGPAVNLILAALVYGLMSWFSIAPNLFEVIFISGKTFLFYLFIANVVLAFFNLIPAFPMDGGRVFRALLSFSLGRDRATRVAALTGQIIAVGFIGVGLFYNPILVFIGIFVYLGAQIESEYTHSGFVLKEYKIKNMLITEYHTLKPDNTIAEAAKLLLEVQAKDFLVADNGKIAGTLNRDEIIKAFSEEGENSLVRDAMNKQFISFSVNDTADRMFNETRKSRQSIFPVFQNGNIAGVVDTDNMVEFLMVNEARAKANRHINHATSAAA